jgi:hypothetical protein
MPLPVIVKVSVSANTAGVIARTATIANIANASFFIFVPPEMIFVPPEMPFTDIR